MIGDIIELKEEHLAIGKEIFEILNTKLPLKSKHKLIIGIAGESGSGKSVTAFALQKILNENNIKSLVWQMDDYFKLPPKSNHENRLKSIENVGIQEVDLARLTENIKDFKKGIRL
jgi:uridine kinase